MSHQQETEPEHPAQTPRKGNRALWIWLIILIVVNIFLITIGIITYLYLRSRGIL